MNASDHSQLVKESTTSTPTASSSPLIFLESIFPPDSFTLPNFSALTHPPSSWPLLTLTDNLRQTLDNLCQNYHHGIQLFEEMLRTVRAKMSMMSNFTDSENQHQIEYFESLLGAVEQNINIWQTQYSNSGQYLSCTSSPDSGYYATTATTTGESPNDHNTTLFQPQLNSSYSLLLESGETIPLTQAQPVDSTIQFPSLANNSQILLLNSNINPLLAEPLTLPSTVTETHSDPYANRHLNENLNNQMILQPQFIGYAENFNYYNFENDSVTNQCVEQQAPIVCQSVLSDISNTHHFLPSNATLDDTEFNRLFDDTSTLSSSDPLIVDMITQPDSLVQLNPNSSVSSAMGFHDDSNTMVVNPEGQLSMNEPNYFSEVLPVIPISLNNTVSSSILGDALAASVFEQTPLDSSICANHYNNG